MYEPKSPIIALWIRGDVTAPATQSPHDAALAHRVLRQCVDLARIGRPVEIWTRQCGDRGETELHAQCVTVHRVPCADCGSVRRQLPGEYVAEFVARAAERLARRPIDHTTLVSHYWDAGIAGKLLAVRFGLAHVHVPHALVVEDPETMGADGPGVRELARRMREERETCRAASRVIATSPAQRDLLLVDPYALAPAKVVLVQIDPLPPADTSPRPSPGGLDVSPLLRRSHLTPYGRPPGVESRLLNLASTDEDSIL